MPLCVPDLFVKIVSVYMFNSVGCHFFLQLGTKVDKKGIRQTLQNHKLFKSNTSYINCYVYIKIIVAHVCFCEMRQSQIHQNFYLNVIHISVLPTMRHCSKISDIQRELEEEDLA